MSLNPDLRDPVIVREEEHEGFDVLQYENDEFEIWEGSTLIADGLSSWDAARAYIEDNLLPVETVSRRVAA